MKITKIEYQKKDPNRVSIDIDGKFATGLDVNDLLKLGLYLNQEISPDLLHKILDSSKFGQFFNAALRFVSFRPRSEKEIRDFFRRKIFRAKVKKGKSLLHKEEEETDLEKAEELKILELVMDKLSEMGQINDLEFAKWFVDQRLTFRQKGRAAIKAELQQKGVAREIVEQMLESGGMKDEKTLAKIALRKKIPLMQKKYSEPVELKKRLQSFLLTRGFSWEISREAVEESLQKE